MPELFRAARHLTAARLALELSDVVPHQGRVEAPAAVRPLQNLRRHAVRAQLPPQQVAALLDGEEPDDVTAALWAIVAYARGGHLERGRELAGRLLRNRELPAGARARIRRELAGRAPLP